METSARGKPRGCMVVMVNETMGRSIELELVRLGLEREQLGFEVLVAEHKPLELPPLEPLDLVLASVSARLEELERKQPTFREYLAALPGNRRRTRR